MKVRYIVMLPKPKGYNKPWVITAPYNLKGIENGLYDEPKVHYFTMAEDKWKSSLHSFAKRVEMFKLSL